MLLIVTQKYKVNVHNICKISGLLLKVLFHVILSMDKICTHVRAYIAVL